ncbi:uncharacterized protein LOC143907588 [Temnothorax americanus]|uniref:uncharacterized protein LOC143907588 n=1 Tax=Temnothorax americanus TaxID=1964332 RepID=UPI0040681D43
MGSAEYLTSLQGKCKWAVQRKNLRIVRLYIIFITVTTADPEWKLCPLCSCFPGRITRHFFKKRSTGKAVKCPAHIEPRRVWLRGLRAEAAIFNYFLLKKF